MANAIDPLNCTNEEFYLLSVLNDNNQKLRVRLPAVVQSYDRDKNTVIVKCGIKIPVNDGEFVELSPFEVKVHRWGGGGYHISFPLKEGDTGDIVFYDRDIQSFLESLQTSEPETTRNHAFEDAEFIPIDREAAESGTEGLYLCSDDGTRTINITEQDIVITNGESSLTLTADSYTIKTTDTTVDSSSTSITGTVDIAKTLDVTGNTTCLANTDSATYSTGGVQGITGVFVNAAGVKLYFTNGLITNVG